MKKIQNIKSKRVFYYFEKISKIPRGSGNERAISNYLLNFGRSLGLECIQDGALNIIIKKRASKGYENSPTVILQGHMDMVCEKNHDKIHDFTKDSIDLISKDDYIYADETTLGADDGIAIAYAMAILEDDTLEHPALEVLLTVDEEEGMSGAFSVQPQYIDGKILINLDSNKEGKILVSCSGGIATKSIIPIDWIDKDEKYGTYTFVIKGLRGGRSGSEIHLERGNSNKLMGRLLRELFKEVHFNIASLDGGSKNNTIPRECTAIITADRKDENKLLEIKTSMCIKFKREFGKRDPDLRVYMLCDDEKVERVFSDYTTQKVINLLYMYPNGVNTMSHEINGLTESSTSLGVVATTKEQVQYESAVRSYVLSLRDEIVERNRCITEMLGGIFITKSPYPVWSYKTDSKIRNICREVYLKMYNKEPQFVAMHAGVECGLFNEKLGNLDMISFGPDIIDAHTPHEHMSISSADRCYEYLLEVLKEIKN